MTMVPRSYMFSGKARSNSAERQRENKSMGVEGLGTRPRSTPPRPPVVPQSRKSDERKPSPSSRRTTEPVEIPERPMYRPVRHSTPSTMVHTGKHGVRTRRRDDVHDPNALPPAVAALLAVTAIPPRRRQARQLSAVSPRQISIDELVKEWRSEPEQPSSLNNRSPLDILLEPCEEPEKTEETEETLALEPESEKDPGFMTSRSVSSASLTSIPSLDAAASTLSSYSDPSTSTPRKSPLDRKEKTVSSPPKEEISLDDHPLRPTSPVEPESFNPQRSSFPKPRPKPSKFTFKSNLTASLLALRTAAKSFSNFTAPSIPSDDLLTRSILSPASAKYPPEMRPRDIDGVPDPALRRYMNPLAYGTGKQFHERSLSCPDFHIDMQRALAQPPVPEEYIVDEFGAVPPPMIQMQTYSKKKRIRSAGRGSSAFLGPDRAEASALLAGSGMEGKGVRQREPRENSDFLRVIVLEMNMRRTGKLDAKAGGRARVWLPPRRHSGNPEVGAERGRVPVRWVGVSCEY